MTAEAPTSPTQATHATARPAGSRSASSAPIACGVDTSPESRTAAAVAADIADRLAARLVLVTASGAPEVVPSRMADEHARLRALRIEAGERTLAEVADTILTGPGRRAVTNMTEGRVELGEPAAALEAAAVELGARLLVVGARGRRAMAAALLGSTSQALLSDPPCPVLVVPSHAQLDHGGRDGRMGKVVCGVDGSRQSLSAARAAAKLASDLGLRLLLAHVGDAIGDRPLEYDARLDSGLRPRLRLLEPAVAAAGDAEVEVVLLAGDPASALVELAELESAELIAVGTRGRGRLKATLIGSVARSLASSAPRPILVVGDSIEDPRQDGKPKRSRGKWRASP